MSIQTGKPSTKIDNTTMIYVGSKYEPTHIENPPPYNVSRTPYITKPDEDITINVNETLIEQPTSAVEMVNEEKSEVSECAEVCKALCGCCGIIFIFGLICVSFVFTGMIVASGTHYTKPFINVRCNNATEMCTQSECFKRIATTCV